MKKKISQPKCADLSLSSVDFVALSKKVFDGDKKTIGGQPIDANVREVLRDEAVFILHSRLWEVMESTMINEAAMLALKQSLNWDHVEFAKALDYWHTVISKMLVTLAK